MNMDGLSGRRHHGKANHGQEILGSSGTLAHSLAMCVIKHPHPRPRPRDGLRGLAAFQIARIEHPHPRRAIN